MLRRVSSWGLAFWLQTEWDTGKAEVGSLITALPAKQEDGPNALAIYHAHRMSLVPFKDYCDAHLPTPSAKDIFSIQVLLDAPPADHTPPLHCPKLLAGTPPFPGIGHLPWLAEAGARSSS